ncbi:MAG: hypothetical protein PHE32_00950 [Candidatus Shapirobacteria bacterium]|nr:hypothetical protein [Candidatus Shapirobacteria bacterium]MDD4410260.1 hypothetical protein [Candidatus Shapirobacteria bacterium]
MCIALQVLDEFDRVFYERAIEKDTSLFGIFDIHFTKNGVKIRFTNKVKEYHFVKSQEFTFFPTDEQYATIVMNEDICNPICFHLTEKRIKEKDQEIDSDVDNIIISQLLPGEKNFILRRINPKSTFEEE